MPKSKLYFVLSTHWDREWYQTFQDFRYRLIDLVDDILEGIDSGGLKGPFYTDGQSCLLEDYLEIRTNKSKHIGECLTSGKIVAGPWYVLPDEFLVSGESTLRNIRLGFETVRQMGAEPSRAGFLCDMFGHISQMPQIFNQFGIKAGFIWRGLNPENRNIIWRGADGGELPVYAFGKYGYGDYATDIRNADKNYYEKFNTKAFRKRLEKYIEQEIEKSEINPILIFDGLDHQCWDRIAYREFFDHVNSNESIEAEHVSLDGYMNEMLKEKDKISSVIKGELRQVARKEPRHLIMGVLSSRVDIKQENAYCENLLCSWAEPLGLFSNLLTNQEYPADFLKVAWKWLIKNHPHDSICGCSIDQVHRDMEFRFSQARQIGERITEEALGKIAINVDADIDANSLRVVVFNPSPRVKNEVVMLPLDIPEDWPNFTEFFGFEKLPAFRIFDTNGNELEYQRVSQNLNVKNKVIFRTKSPRLYSATRVRVAIEISVPAMGYKTLIVRTAEEGEPVRHSSRERMSHSGNCLENGLLKVTVNTNGTLCMLDKQSGQRYDDLMIFEEDADIGDGWYHGIAVNDWTVRSTANPAQISIISNGPELATLRVTNRLRLPDEFCFDTMKRSSHLKEFTIDNLITLRKDSQKLEIETQINNNIKDHRLRVCFRSNAQTHNFFTDSPFDVVERTIKLDKDNYKYKELDVETKPQQSWAAIADNNRGLAVVSTGLYESAVSDDEAKDIKLTLFRSTRQTVMTSGEPDGQLLKPLTFRYCVMPISGGIDRIKLFEEAQSLANGVRAAQLRKCDLDAVGINPKLPPEQGFMDIKGAVLTNVSSFRGNIEIRFFNPLDIDAVAEIGFASKTIAADFSKAWKVDFDANKLGEGINICEGLISVPMRAKEIVTLTLDRWRKKM
ncbi:MAG: glycoside hydrolase [Planctomycetes bacterium]|nr:glycoside hydrolase [Planctomycetota bacterium]